MTLELYDVPPDPEGHDRARRIAGQPREDDGSEQSARAAFQRTSGRAS